jgi:predicted GIY-YIG superfamily endonuclease
VSQSQKPGVYRIPCQCGLVYIGETGQNLSIRLKEHKTNCEKPSEINLLWLNIVGLTTIV